MSTTQDQLPRRATLTRNASQTLAEQLAAQVAQQVHQRVLATGARLPSVRDAARRHGVSPATVVSAYDRLQAQGLIEARPQRGFFVRELAATEGARADRQRAKTSAAAPAGPSAAATAPVDATALIRGMFQPVGTTLSPGIGTVPADWLDPGLLQRAIRRVCTAESATDWLGYGDPAGSPALRSAVARRLADLGIGCTAEQIVTTVGATHGLDLISRALLQPGDAVLVDEPGWSVEFARLQRLGMRIVPVPRGASGPDLDAMAALCRSHRPRLYVTVSVLHNPTGASLSAASAHRVLQLAEQHDLTIVEDDSYAWFAPAHSLRLSALDGLRRTVLVSGFSKILAPQWRVGFVAAPAALRERLIDTKLLATLTSPALLEQAVAQCLEHGQLRRHADRIVLRLAEARTRAVQLAEGAGCRLASAPAGLFGWVDAGVDTERLAVAMHDQGWLLAPGSLFHATRRPSSLMRINFAATQRPDFWRAFEQMRDKLR